MPPPAGLTDKCDQVKLNLITDRKSQFVPNLKDPSSLPFCFSLLQQGPLADHVFFFYFFKVYVY